MVGKTTYTVVQYQVKMLLVLLTTLHLLDEFVMFIDEQIKGVILQYLISERDRFCTVIVTFT